MTQTQKTDFKYWALLSDQPLKQTIDDLVEIKIGINRVIVDPMMPERVSIFNHFSFEFTSFIIHYLIGSVCTSIFCIQSARSFTLNSGKYLTVVLCLYRPLWVHELIFQTLFAMVFKQISQSQVE